MHASSVTKGRVMVVDDNDSGRYALSHPLRQHGYEVTEAASAEECFQKLQISKPELILLDVKLPDASGFEVCRRLKHDPTTAHLPIIQISALLTKASDRVSGLQSGADAYLNSPYDPSEVLAYVEMLLRASRAENRLRRTIDLNPQIPWSADAHGIVDDVSTGWLRLTGLRAEEALKGGWHQVCHPDDVERMFSALKQCIRTGEPLDVKHRVKTASGDYRWMRSRAYPDRAQDGAIERWYGFTEDVDAQVQAERALRESEARYRALTTNIQGGAVLVLDETLRCKTAGGEALKAAGFVAEQLSGKTLHEILPKALADAFMPNFARALDGHSFEREHQFEGRWFSTLGVPVREDGGHVRSVLAMVYDITERKDAEGRLRSVAASLSLAQEASQSGMWDWQLETGERFVSAQYRQLFGFAAESNATLEDWISCIHPDDRDRVTRNLQMFLDGTQNEYCAEYRIQHPKRGERWIAAIGRLQRGKDGRPIRFTGICIDYTQQKRAEMDLKRSRDRLDLLSRTVSTLLTCTDPQPVINSLCDEVRQFLGCSVFFNFLVDESTRRLRFNTCGGVDPRIARKVEGLELEASLCGTAAQGACRVLADGIQQSNDERSALVRSLGVRSYACHPLLNQRGEAMGTLSFGASDRDFFTTDDLELMRTVSHHVAVALLRSETEKALRLADERLHQALTAGRVITFHWDPRLDIIHRSRNSVDIMGAGAVHGTGAEFFNRVHPEDRPCLTSCISKLTPHNPDYNLCFRYIRSDNGAEIILEDAGHGEFDQDGGLIVLQGLVRDVTQQKQAEAQLRESEERLRLAKTAARIGIFDFNPETRRGIWDERVRELWGLDAEVEVTEEVFEAGVHPDDIAAVNEAVQRALDPSGDGCLYVEHRVIGGGAARWVAASGHATWSNGRPTRLVGTVQDITERKEFQAELERLVTARTAKLQELVAELEHFSYSITHDMRAPLRAMRGFAEALGDVLGSNAAPEALMFLSRINSGAERMDLLITDALNYGRAVRQDLALGPVDTARLLEGMLDTYPEFINHRSCIGTKGPLPSVIANEAGLTQCLSNLLCNALKFTPPGEPPSVKIWAEPAPPPTKTTSHAQWIRLCVEDRGIGIPSSMMPRLFGMFARGTASYEGTGIGLALVRKVVERMGGRVGVHSELGHGSRFWLDLPAAPDRR